MVDFMNVKNDIILKKILNNLKKNKSLDILKYNKKFQKRPDLSINDYKDYSQLFSSIEIELIPADKEYGTFINIKDEEKEYYHYWFYFNNSNTKIKNPILYKDEKVKKIKIIIDYQVKSFHKLFNNIECISSIVFKKFYRTNITDMSYMFSGCSSLKELDLSNFNTDNVANMGSMFGGCSSLKELNISNFNTNNVKDMSYMLSGCSLLNELNLSNFNTKNVKDMSYMFTQCLSLKK